MTAKGVQWNYVDFALFVQYLSSFFVRRTDGRIDFTHKNIRAGCLKLIEDKKAAHADIVAHLKTLDAKDELKQNEIVWHCFNADDKETLLNYIGNTFKMDESSILDLECENIFKVYGADWWRDILEYGKLEKFSPIRKILSLFFGQLFYYAIYMSNIEEKIKLNYSTYVRLNCREYPDLLIATYVLLGTHYNGKKEKLAYKFANKGIAIVKKFYTRQEIEKFTTCVVEDMMVVEGELSPRADIFYLKESVETIKGSRHYKVDDFMKPNPENPKQMIVKSKIDW